MRCELPKNSREFASILDACAILGGSADDYACYKTSDEIEALRLGFFQLAKMFRQPRVVIRREGVELFAGRSAWDLIREGKIIQVVDAYHHLLEYQSR